MNKIKVEIHYVEHNYCASVPQLPGCVSVGDTLESIKHNIKEAIAGHIAVSQEFGDAIPIAFQQEYELVFYLSTEALLNAYSNIFTKAALSRVTGINERQLWHYAAGIRKPRPLQRKRIEEGLHHLGKQLLEVNL